VAGAPRVTTREGYTGLDGRANGGACIGPATVSPLCRAGAEGTDNVPMSTPTPVPPPPVEPAAPSPAVPYGPPASASSDAPDAAVTIDLRGSTVAGTAGKWALRLLLPLILRAIFRAIFR
jgi:hypothetical protein